MRARKWNAQFWRVTKRKNTHWRNSLPKISRESGKDPDSFESHQDFDTTPMISSFPKAQVIAEQQDRGRWQYLGFDECEAIAYYLGSKDEPVVGRIIASAGNFPEGWPTISYEREDFARELKDAVVKEDDESPFRW